MSARVKYLLIILASSALLLAFVILAPVRAQTVSLSLSSNAAGQVTITPTINLGGRTFESISYYVRGVDGEFPVIISHSNAYTHDYGSDNCGYRSIYASVTLSGPTGAVDSERVTVAVQCPDSTSFSFTATSDKKNKAVITPSYSAGTSSLALWSIQWDYDDGLGNTIGNADAYTYDYVNNCAHKTISATLTLGDPIDSAKRAIIIQATPVTVDVECPLLLEWIYGAPVFAGGQIWFQLGANKVADSTVTCYLVSPVNPDSANNEVNCPGDRALRSLPLPASYTCGPISVRAEGIMDDDATDTHTIRATVTNNLCSADATASAVAYGTAEGILPHEATATRHVHATATAVQELGFSGVRYVASSDQVVFGVRSNIGDGAFTCKLAAGANVYGNITCNLTTLWGFTVGEKICGDVDTGNPRLLLVATIKFAHYSRSHSFTKPCPDLEVSATFTYDATARKVSYTTAANLHDTTATCAIDGASATSCQPGVAKEFSVTAGGSYTFHVAGSRYGATASWGRLITISADGSSMTVDPALQLSFTSLQYNASIDRILVNTEVNKSGGGIPVCFVYDKLIPNADADGNPQLHSGEFNCPIGTGVSQSITDWCGALTIRAKVTIGGETAIGEQDFTKPCPTLTISFKEFVYNSTLRRVYYNIATGPRPFSNGTCSLAFDEDIAGLTCFHDQLSYIEVDAGGVYTFVASYSVSGNSVSVSNKIFISADGNSAATATPPPPPTPEIGAAPPGNLAVAPLTGVATWDAVAGATGYEIELRVGSAGATTTLALGQVTTVNFTSHASASNCCVNGEQYSARIRAVQNDRQSAWSLWETFVFSGTSSPGLTLAPFTVTLDNMSYVYGTGLFWYELSSSKVVSFSCNIGGASFSCSAGRSSRAVAAGGVYTVTACATFGGVMKGAAVTLSVLPAPGPAIIAPLDEAVCAAASPPDTPTPTATATQTETATATQSGTAAARGPGDDRDDRDHRDDDSDDDGDGLTRRQARERPGWRETALAIAARTGGRQAVPVAAASATCSPGLRPVLTDDHWRWPNCDTLISDSQGIQFRAVRSAGIGLRSVLDLGALGLIDIGGPAYIVAEVCFAGRGSLFWLDSVYNWREARPLRSTLRDGKTCARVTRAGLVVLMPGDPTEWIATPTRTATMTATVGPLPPTQDFRSLADGVTVKSDSPGIQVREIRAANVGQTSALDRRANGAVEIRGPAEIVAEVCLEGFGSLAQLESLYDAGEEKPLLSYTLGSQTCALVTGPGIVILVPGEPSTLAPAAGVASRPLGVCMVTLNHVLNFRDAPGGERLHFVDRWGNDIAGWLPDGVTLTALERTADWFKVDYYGTLGWVSAHYVTPQGACG